jgi:glutamine synthetase
MNQEASQLSVHFGENTFGFEQMRERLPREFYDKLMFAIRNQRPISQETADVISQAMKDWAI